jgi:glutathione reductase (NADPH)
MTFAAEVDLFVVGGGSGGVRAARIAAGYGAKVMLAEEFRMGGTCVIRGCVPKKLYVMASRYANAFEEARGFGWGPAKSEFNWQRLVGAKEGEITRLEGLYTKGQQGAGVEVVKQRATLEAPGVVKLAGESLAGGKISDGRLIKAKHILIATGGRPNLDTRIPGIENVVTSDSVFDLEEFPKHIVIAGGGYIALEFAGIFRLLGAQVTVVYRGAQPLRGFEQDLRDGLQAAYEKMGITFVLNDTFARIDRSESGLVATLKSGGTLAADQILFAIGRSPNVEGLGLERLGVASSADGAIVVDDEARTNIPGLYAVGDVTNRVNLTPVAIREGHAFADRTFGGKAVKVEYDLIPTAVFTTPELGTLGLTEAEARERFDVVDIYKTEFRPMRATLSGTHERTMMKLVVDGNTDKVLGVHLLGEGAGEMIQLLGIPLRMGATKADFDATMAVHPTAAEELVTLRSRTARYERAKS